VKKNSNKSNNIVNHPLKIENKYLPQPKILCWNLTTP